MCMTSTAALPYDVRSQQLLLFLADPISFHHDVIVNLSLAERTASEEPKDIWMCAITENENEHAIYL